MQLSKSQFKPKALEWMRKVEQTGEPIIITDHGVPTLELRPYRASETREDPRDYLQGSVLSFEDPFSPVEPDDWESTQ